jgi:flagellar basal body-associated protein FliL
MAKEPAAIKEKPKTPVQPADDKNPKGAQETYSASRPKAPLVTANSIVVLLAVMLVEGLVIFLALRSCPNQTNILDSANTPLSTQGVNPNVETVRSLQIPLNTQGPADIVHHIQVSYYLEISRPEFAEQIKKDLAVAQPWIIDCTIGEIEKLTYDDVRTGNAKATVGKNLLQKINDKLGPRGNEPQIKSIFWTQWDHY